MDDPSFIQEFKSFCDTYNGPANLDKLFDAFKLSRKPSIKSLDRDKLQSGEISNMMSDDEIHEYFTADMRLKRFNTTVHPIPAGDPVYMLCIFQGKRGTV